ncbi:hypothetical protein [Aeromonas hydrophila]|uniref:hypothetical protein n=1 Tax=Aeromonas hydrophila TaxID=644 RepID=UPI000A5673A8|nr:hypothetical protein [Aeromonas hydrophila]HAU4929253.1 hypothetical protein [Aeromonas hydrophila]
MKKFLSAKACSPLAIKSLLPKFETEEECYKEKQLRVNTLSRSELIKARRLAEKLSDCDDEEPCFSFSCPVCVREFRIKKISQLALLCEDYQAWKFVTIIYYDRMTSTLGELSIQRLIGRLRKQLKRSGISDVLIGFFEVDYHPEYQRWMPHFHLLVRCDSTRNITWRKLRDCFNKCGKSNDVDIEVRRPTLVKRLKNPLGLISYICKIKWMRVESYYVEGERMTRKLRLKKVNFVHSLLTLDSLKLSDIEFMHGIRQHGATLRESVLGKK